MNAIKAIEQIASSNDRQQAIIFFLYFSRFEYSLKRLNYLTKSEEAKPDWDRYCRDNPNLLDGDLEEHVKNALKYLKNAPPKKQVVKNNGLDWEDDNYTGKYDLCRILTLLRRIRNNLFHGGKFPGGPKNDISRDRKLLESGLIIMQACLDRDNELEGIFLEYLLES